MCVCVCVLPANRLWLESWCLAACRSWLLVQLETCWIPKSPVPEQRKCIFSHGPLFGSSLHSCFDYFSIAAKSSRSSSTATPRSPGCTLCTQVLSATTRFCLDLTQGCAHGLLAASGPSATNPCVEPGPGSAGRAGGILQILSKRDLLPSSYRLPALTWSCLTPLAAAQGWGWSRGFF